MKVIKARNVNDALEAGLHHLKMEGVLNDSRNGPVLVAPTPVVTEYLAPQERVLFSELRDANPFFHFYECLWMLAGCNDEASVAHFAKNMSRFADDGVMWGAYGFRWREFFGFDQLLEIVKLLKRDPKTRRAVLTMWSPLGDLVSSEGAGGIHMSDVPCNTQVYFDLTTGVLNMTVCNRSNDIVWGAYGANAVHMSFLQEFVARSAGAPMGCYYQFSNNYHAYTENDVVKRLYARTHDNPRFWGVSYENRDHPYRLGFATNHPLMVDSDDWLWWLDCCSAVAKYRDGADAVCGLHPYFTDVALPILRAHTAYKEGKLNDAHRELEHCVADDWKLACCEWLERRATKRAEASV